MPRQPVSLAPAAVSAAALLAFFAIDAFSLPAGWFAVLVAAGVAGAVLLLKDLLRPPVMALQQMPWWIMARTVRDGVLLAALLAAVSITGWARVAFTDAGVLASMTALLTSLLSAAHFASALALRRLQHRG